MNSVSEYKKIKFASSCSIANLEKSIRDFYRTNGTTSLLFFDLSDVTYIEVPALIFFIGFVDKKNSEDIDIKIELPKHKGVRDIIRYFRLPSILKSLTGKSFQNIVTFDSLKYFGENINMKGDYWDYLKTKRYPNFDSLADAIAINNIFCELIPFKEDFEKTYALEKLHSDWNGAEIKAFLKSHLDSTEDNKERLVPNRIIYECVTNSQRHSSADKLVVAAIVQKQQKSQGEVSDEKYKQTFNISFWDNGESMIETLSRTLESGNPIRDNDIQKDIKTKNIQASYFVKYENSAYNEEVIHSDIGFDEIANDKGLIFLSSFFPGVSKDPKGLFKWKENPDFEKEDSALKHPGMGLTTLLNAVIDLLEGQVSVRAENYFLNIKKPDSKKAIEKLSHIQKYEKCYQVKIEKYEDSEPQLKGNMLTVRLPLK